MSLRLNSLLILALALLYPAVSQALQGNNLTIHGYLSQGYVYSTGNEFINGSKEGSFDVQQAGVNLLYRPFGSTYLSGQLIHRNFGDYEYNEENLGVDYLYLGTNLFSSYSLESNLTIGRNKIPFGLLNETSDVAFTHSGILLPQGFYSDHNRGYRISSDGLRVDLNYRGEIGSFHLDCLFGSVNRRTKRHYTETFDTHYLPYVTQYKSPDMDVFRLEYTSSDNRLLLAYTNIDVSTVFTEIDDSVTIPLYPYVQSIYEQYYYQAYSIQLQLDQFTISSELLQFEQRHWNTTFFPTYNVSFPQEILSHSKSYYIQFNYHYSSKLDLIARLERAYSNKNNPDGSGLQYPHTGYLKNLVFGLDWKINSNTLFKTELHHMEGLAGMRSIPVVLSDISSGRPPEKYWNLFLMQISYRF